RISRCLALTEPDAGSDASRIRSRARRVAGGWVINGRKTFVTNGAEADVALVVARTDGESGLTGGTAATTFLVDQGTPGYQPTRRRVARPRRGARAGRGQQPGGRRRHREARRVRVGVRRGGRRAAGARRHGVRERPAGGGARAAAAPVPDRGRYQRAAEGDHRAGVAAAMNRPSLARLLALSTGAG